MITLSKTRILGALFLLTAASACGGAESAEGDTVPAHAQGHPGAHEGSEHGGHGAHGGHGGAHEHDFSDAEGFAELFDDPSRDEWQQPAAVIEKLELAEGMIVADIGAGTGYFLPHLSRAVGTEGHVLGLDVEPNMVRYMTERIGRDGLTNAEAREVPTSEPGLEAASVDRILIVNTWHHISDREAYAAKLMQALRPGGFVLVVDFTEDAPHGPPPAMRLPPETVAQELEAAGFTTTTDTDALSIQYVVRGSQP